MAKAGKIDKITENDSSFEGSGVEGQKDFDTEGATPIVTNRDGGPKRIWFRDGKEIGSEDV